MKPSRAWFQIPAFVSMCVLLASAALAQSYGPDEQVLTIGAAEFQPKTLPGGVIESDGYLYFAEVQEDYLAPVSIPLGAHVDQFCLYAFDSDPDDWLEAVMIAVRLVPGGESPAVFSLGPGASTGSGANDGYGEFCASVGYDHRGKIDVDGDGTLDDVAYYVRARIPNAHPVLNPLGLGGVKIRFRREVSPPETVTFADVPPSDPGFGYIEALVASGITAGCGAGNYCPDASLTRRQMAVFLAKALGLHWADTTP